MLRKTLIWLTVVFVVAAGLTPSAMAQDNPEDVTSNVAFYGHIFGIGRGAPMPMNTQFPSGESDLSQGFTAHSCGLPGSSDTDTDNPSCEADTSNEEWFYTTAGFVQIKNNAEFAYDKLHNERGLTKDTKLDTAQPITATFYMSADAHGWLVALCQPEGIVAIPEDTPWPVPCWQWDPGYLSQWQVEATLYTGVLGDYGGEADTAPDIATALADGLLTPLATGVSKPIDVQSLEATGNPTVWKFDIDLGVAQRDTIKKEESYIVRYQWWSVKPDGSRAVYPEADTWNVNSGEFYPPVINLPVKGAFTVELVVPQFVFGKLVFLGVMNTPWGSYDVDQDSIELTVTKQGGSEFTPTRIERLADFSVAHGGHYKPVNLTYVWDYKADKLPAGAYDVTIKASNFQGSASAECTGSFTVKADGDPGEITVGECGVRTISTDGLNDIQQGSAQDAAGSSRGPDGAPLPAVSVAQIGIATAGFTPVSGAGLSTWSLLALAVLAFARRWSS